MIDLDFSFTATVWKHSGKAAWYFVTLPKDMSDDIKAFTRHTKTGWGSVRVHARIGETRAICVYLKSVAAQKMSEKAQFLSPLNAKCTTWNTSIFPDKKSGAYLLPIKAAVRKAEGIGGGDEVAVALRVEI